MADAEAVKVQRDRLALQEFLEREQEQEQASYSALSRSTFHSPQSSIGTKFSKMDIQYPQSPDPVMQAEFSPLIDNSEQATFIDQTGQVIAEQQAPLLSVQ